MHFLECLGRPSLRLTFSYLLDWVVIIAAAGIGVAFNSIEPYKRPFSLLDLDISFPFAPSTVSVTTVVLISIIAPGILILLFTLIFIPGPQTCQHLTRAQIWRRKLWEWHIGWLGLGLSLATSYFLTQGLKNLFGVPRPHMLAVCDPDLSGIATHVVGGFGQDTSARWTLVSASICKTTDHAQLKDSFRSFPSGHASTSAAGLLYLSLWLAAKLGVRLPSLHPSSSSYQQGLQAPTHQSSNATLLPLHTSQSDAAAPHPRGTENIAAAPPITLFFVSCIPFAIALYIASSRYADFHHHGFDVICGTLLGSATAVFAFRCYHMPAGAGWAWGPRSIGRAFGVGVGTAGYVGRESWESTVVGKGRKGKAGEQGKVEDKEEGQQAMATEEGTDVEGVTPLVNAYEWQRRGLVDP